MKHEYTVEILYHFTCCRCQLWWSWTSTPSQLDCYSLRLPEDDSMFCPHCGAETQLKIKDGFILSDEN